MTATNIEISKFSHAPVALFFLLLYWCNVSLSKMGGVRNHNTAKGKKVMAAVKMPEVETILPSQ